MVAATIDRWGALRALVLGGLAVAGVMACASAQTPEAEEARAADVLSDVRVEQLDDVTVVTIQGPEDPVFTAFDRGNPPGVVVDLARVESHEMQLPQAGADSLVEEVTVSPFATGSGDAMTRVEIALATPSRYEVRNVDGGLEVHLWADDAPDSAMAADEEPLEVASEDDPWANAEPIAADDEAFEASEEAVPAVSAPPATTLEAVDVTTTDGGMLVHLKADGAVEETQAFTLADPARLVVDLPGLASTVSQGRVSGDGTFVSRIRIGAHSDKVRVVMDGVQKDADFAGRRVLPVNDGLVVTLGAGSSLDEAVAAIQGAAPAATEVEGATLVAAEADDAPAESVLTDDEVAMLQSDAEPVASTGSADAMAGLHVYGVHFEPQADKDRLVVLSSAPVAFDLLSPDAETLVVSLPGATIDPEAAVRISPEMGGPVSLVSAFQQPDVPGDEVRVVVQRAANLEPTVTQKGSLLFVDFPRTGVAATPPVFEAPVAVTEAGSLEQPLQVAPELAASVDGTLAGEDAALQGGEDGVLMPDLASLEAETLSLDATPLPAALGPQAGAPASLEPPAAVDLLQEGGLIEGKEYRGRRISLDFKDVDIEDVLRLVAEVSDLNIIAGEEVEGKVTIRLVDVPWDQALDVILLTKGLGFVRVGNVLRIAPIDILAQEDEARLQERRAKEKLEDLVVKLQPVNYASVDEVSKMVQRLLSARGTVNVDKRTSTLIIKDIPSVIDEATALVKAIDTMTPQVLIEAKIVEAALSFSRELGVVWGIGTQPLNDGFDPGSGARTDLGGGDFKFHDVNNVAFANPITSLATGLYNLNAFALDDKLNLNLQLQAAESNGDGKVISSPRVVTLDNREAQIEQGVSIPFQTFENGDAQLEFIDAVLSLTVTPHITADKSIIMDIEVTRNAPDDTVPTPTGSPAIAKNQATTETLVKDGQTLVIGGIYTVTKSERQSRVPYLHAIPILGAAFKSREISDERKELLIFVTPRVVLQPEEVS